MVANTFQRAQHPDHAQYPRNRARVFHHVGHQFTQGGLVLPVDGLVVLSHGQCQVGVEAGKSVQRIADHVAHLVTDVAHFHIAPWRLAFFTQLDGPAGDLGRFVTNALQVDHRLGDTDDQAQVGGRRLPTGEDTQAFLVDIALHLVDLLVNLAHLLGQARIGFDQRGDRVVDLFFNQPAHGQQVAAHLFQLGIELLGNVVGKAFFVDHAVAPRSC